MAVPQFYDMFMIKKILKKDYDGKYGLKSKNKDRVVVITGNEGVGKSNLLLGMHHIWIEEILGKKITEEHIKYVASNKEEWVTALKEAKKYNRKYMMVSHDEAGKDLYSRNALSNFSKEINIAYQVVRGLNMYSILVIPSITDLDTFFRRRRVTDMYHVYAEGRVAYYSKKELQWLVPAMENMSKGSSRPDPMRAKTSRGTKVYPRFLDTFPLYKGPLLEMYLERKDNNMKDVINELFDKYNNKANKVPASKRYHKDVKKMVKKGIKRKEIAEKLGITTRTVYNALHYGET